MLRRDPILLSFGLNVAKYRQAKGFSQEKLAERADLDRTYISDIERGTRNPGIKNVVRLAKALDITTSELVEGVEK